MGRNKFSEREIKEIPSYAPHEVNADNRAMQKQLRHTLRWTIVQLSDFNVQGRPSARRSWRRPLRAAPSPVLDEAMIEQ
jgi:hypothetical protein